MSKEMYLLIKEKYPDCLESMSKISKSDKKTAFISSNIVMINMDKLAKSLGSTFRSPDALFFSRDKLLFLEFKDRNFSDVKIDDKCRNNKIKKGIKGKIYEGITILLSLIDTFIPPLKIDIIIICNPKENESKNPAQDALQQVIVNKTQLDREELRTKHFKETLHLYFSPLSKLGIHFEFFVFLSKNSLDGFINSLSSE